MPSSWRSTTLGTGSHNGSASILADPDGNHFLSIATANGFYAMGPETDFDPTSFPSLSWRWRVHQFPSGANIEKKSGDDAAARLYIVFSSRSFFHPLSTHALVYVWDTTHPVGAILKSPYAPEHERIIVQESGPAKLGGWVKETADLARDYKKAFGKSPDKVSAIAFASDSDNTHSATLGDFDDLIVTSLPAAK